MCLHGGIFALSLKAIDKYLIFGILLHCKELNNFKEVFIMKNSVLRKVLAVSLAAMLFGTGFTTIGSYIGTGVSVSAAESWYHNYGDFRYVINDNNTITITSYNTSHGGYIEIPDTINGKSVTEIGIEAFRFCRSLTNIIIPDSVTKIGRNAFDNCTSLTNITIPGSVTSIGNWAFEDCISLTSITIENGVTSIGTGVFAKCTLTSVTIPDSVTSIGIGGFGAYLTRIEVSPNNTMYSSDNGVLFNKNKTTIIDCPDGKTGKYVIPNSVTEIGYGAFDGCTGLTSITIPDSVTSIGNWAFNHCKGLTSITIPDSVTSIGESAFPYCTGLTSITIPDSVTSIGRWAFDHCTDLTIYGKKGSYAETYANKNGISFVAFLLNESEISADEIVLGNTVTVSAKAEGGVGECTYAVFYKKSYDTKWVTAQGYKTNDTVTLKPAKAADYQICVKVKDTTGKVVKKYFTVKVNAKLANKSTVSATEVAFGSTVTVNAAATGGMGDYTYAVLYKKDYDNNWTVKQGYKTNTTVSIKPAKKTTYNVCVKVKDKDGTIAKKYFNVLVK